MDQRMPEMDGEEAFRRIRSHKNGPNADTPVICLTADAVVGARERYLSKGFNDYLTKPIDSTYLEMMLKKYIPAEKIELVTEEEKAAAKTPATPAKTPSSLMRALEDCGIDIAKGITNCAGDEDFYLSILKEYVSGAEEKKSDLAKYIDAKDLKNYEILIHSIKSTSATIGADVPYKLAQKLESAAKENDLGYILSNHEGFLAGYNAVLDAVRKTVTDEEDPDDGFDDDGVMEFAPDPD
jgi:CheY-like chemotaxis protein